MRLSPVLAETDINSVELQAARLDGEVYQLADAYCLVGELEAPQHRARAVLGTRSPRLIAELGTAAWIWGAAVRLPRLEFAVTPDSRARFPPRHRIAVREIVYEPGDVTELGGVRMTTPLRTILDLVRVEHDFDPAMTARLAAIGELHPDDCLAALESRDGIPARERARNNLRRALYAVDTR